MQLRKLGNSGLEIAPLVFGGNVFGWTTDEQASFKLLDAFVDAGFNMIDTADMYSIWVPGHKGGESEVIIGNWMKARANRSKVLIATKVGMDLGDGKKGLSKPYIRQAVEDSLRRLQTDYIDLYQSHADDRETPLEETLSAYQELIDEGKVKAIGASNYSEERLQEALDVSHKESLARYECLQPCYNLYDRQNYEQHLEKVCSKNDLGVIPYFPLAAGFLTGKYRTEQDLSKSERGPGMKKYLNERGERILSALDEVAARDKATPAEVALAWVAARPSITAPIASATNLDQFKELVDSTRLKLESGDIELLNEASQ
jgi:aryl-alcohol dehydrogenase-like predicted oxidoreductase